MFDGKLGAGLVLPVKRVESVEVRADKDDRHAEHAQFLGQLIVGHDPDEQKPVHGPSFEKVSEGALWGLPLQITKQEVYVLVVEPITDALQQSVVERRSKGGDGHREGPRRVLGEGLCRSIRSELKFLNRAHHVLTRLVGNVLRVVQHARDCGDCDPRVVGNVVDGGFRLILSVFSHGVFAKFRRRALCLLAQLYF